MDLDCYLLEMRRRFQALDLVCRKTKWKLVGFEFAKESQ